MNLPFEAEHTAADPRADADYARNFAAEVFKAAILGAFETAIGARRKEEGLTQRQLAERLGKDETAVSRLLKAPSNWQLKTVSDLAEALELDIRMELVDRKDERRIFTFYGVVRMKKDGELLRNMTSSIKGFRNHGNQIETDQGRSELGTPPGHIKLSSSSSLDHQKARKFMPKSIIWANKR